MAQLVEILHDDLRVVGFSMAGEETYFVVPEMDLAFDVGRSFRDVVGVNNVFLSHGHMDHAAGVAYYFSQRMFIDNTAGRMFVPAPLVDPLQKLLRIWADIDGHEPASNIVAVAPGVDVPLRRDLIVRPFEVNHPCRRHDRTVVRSLGFSAIEVRQKLKDEYVGLEGPALVALKKKGVEITRRVELPLITYCGDTAVGEFFDLDCVRNSRLLLLECTFVEPDHVDRARAGFHLHIRDLPGVIARLNNERIVLTHLSPHRAARARELLRRELDDTAAARVSFLMEHRRRRGRPPPRDEQNPSRE